MRKGLVVVAACLLLTGCGSSKQPSIESLFQNAYGEEPVSASFYQVLDMQGSENDSDMHMRAEIFVHDIFKDTSHLRCILTINDENVSFEEYMIQDGEKIATYMLNNFGSYDLVRESTEFSSYIPNLEVSAYENLSLTSDNEHWIVRGVTDFGALSQLSTFGVDASVNVEFIFDKATGYIIEINMSLPSKLEKDAVVVDTMTLTTQITNINTTVIDLPEGVG